MIPRLGFSPAGCASHASIVVPSSTLISTCCEVRFDIAAKRLSEFRDGGPAAAVYLSMTSRFDSPKCIITGRGCRAQSADLLTSLHAQRTLIVADPFFASSESLGEMRTTLAAKGIAVELFTEFQPDPTDQNVLA